jgi:hypothetical protein
VIGAVRCVCRPGRERGLWISAAEWARRDADLLAFDEVVHRGEDSTDRLDLLIALRLDASDEEERAVAEIGNRYQRLVPRRNHASQGRRWRAIMERYRSLHQLSQLRPRGDHDHGLDAWQWLLRLEPEASLELQLAALFHDIERQTSEPSEPSEQDAPDYARWKKAHAERSAAMLEQVLPGLGLDRWQLGRTAELVGQHEDPGGDAELQLLNDADALSFFALCSWGFARVFGAQHARRKARHTLGRMSPRGKDLLGQLELRVSELVASEIASALR